MAVPFPFQEELHMHDTSHTESGRTVRAKLDSGEINIIVPIAVG